MPRGRTETGRKDRQDWKEKLATATGIPKTTTEVSLRNKNVGHSTPKSKETNQKPPREEEEEKISRGFCLNEQCLEGLEPNEKGVLVAGRKKIFNKFHAVHKTSNGDGRTCCKKCDAVFLSTVKPYDDEFTEEKYFERLRQGKLHRVNPGKEALDQQGAN